MCTICAQLQYIIHNIKFPLFRIRNINIPKRDPFGKTATEIISYLLSNTVESFDEKACRKLIKEGARAKSNEIIEAIIGYNMGRLYIKR
ncbi:MAG: hypothetical protein K0S04_3482 [Herbinix sp.]|jgi:hypothetical protein|nr:hypothetical protein [Herbinix sp.]